MRDEYAKVRYKERIKSGYTCEGVKAVVLPAQQTIQQRSTTHRNHSTAQYNAQKPFNNAVQRTETIQQHSTTHRNHSTTQYNAQKPFNNAVQRTETIQQRSTTHRNHSTAQYNAQTPFNNTVKRTETNQQCSTTHRNWKHTPKLIACKALAGSCRRS